MVSLVAADKKEWLTRNCSDLRNYAERVVVDEEELTPYETEDQAHLMKEFMALGDSFKLTQRDMVRLIYG